MTVSLRALLAASLLAVPLFNATAQVHNPADDFSLARNPNGVWSYGWRPASQPLSGPLTLLDYAHTISEGLETWASSLGYGHLHHNGSGQVIRIKGVGTWQPGDISLHPGYEGQYTTVRWTAPMAGSVSLAVRLWALDEAFTHVIVAFRDTVLMEQVMDGTGSVAGYSPTRTLSVEAGDTIEFLVGGTYSDGNTGLRASIVLTPPDVLAPLVGAVSALRSSPTAVDGIVYVGCDDGWLYAHDTADGSPAAGFPVDLAAGRILARPAFFVHKGRPAIYISTENGYVAKVRPDGFVSWSVRPIPGGSSVSTPAVTPDGEVFVGMSDASGSYVLKLDASDGYTLKQSVSLGAGPIGSPAVQGGSVHVALKSGSTGGIVVLNTEDLTVRASFAPGESATTPFVKDSVLYVGTGSGNVYKVNSTTMSLDAGFGNNGGSFIGEPVTTETFPDNAGALYVGTGTGRVYRIDRDSGMSTLFHDTGQTASIGGLLLDVERNLLAYGTMSGEFWQVPTVNPEAAALVPLIGSLSGAPTLDRSTSTFFAGTEAGRLYGVPRL